MKNFKKYFCLFLLFNTFLYAQIEVSLPDTSAETGASILIPVYTGNLNGQNVISYQFTVLFDNEILNSTGIETNGALSSADGWTALSNTNVPGEITVGAFGANPLSGGGKLVYLKFNVAGDEGTSPLDFDNFAFNSGMPASNTNNGSVSIGVSGVTVSLPDTTVENGTSIEIPVYVGDLTGLDVISYQFKLLYDEEILNSTGIKTDGTLSSANGWTALSNTNVPGEIIVGAFGAYPLDGGGILIYMTFEIIGEDGSSSLSFDNFAFNSGMPASSTENGSITIGALQSIQLLSPNGGEVWPAGSVHAIQWSSSGIEQCRIEYSTNNGTDWMEIIDLFPSSVESFLWEIPNTPSSECIIKICDCMDDDPADFSDAVFQIEPVTDVKDNFELQPDKFILFQNYPNPFNPNTKISYNIASHSFVKIEVFNSLGEKAAGLVNEFMNPGYYEIMFDGNLLPSGLYVYRITAVSNEADVFTYSKKMSLLK